MYIDINLGNGILHRLTVNYGESIEEITSNLAENYGN